MSIVSNVKSLPMDPELLYLLNFISDCVWKAEPSEGGKLNYQYVSPGIEHITGVAAENFLGVSGQWLSFVHPEDSSYVETCYRRMVNGEALSDRNEYRIQTRTGLKYVRENILVQRDPVRDSKVLYGVISDITERSGYQEEKARLAAIVESSDDCILSKSLSGIILTWNHGAELMYGYTAAEIVGHSVARLIPSEREGELESILGKIAQGGRIDHFETVRRRKDGTLFEVCLSVSPLKDASGRVVGASTIARDISVQKKLEHELHRKNLALQKSNTDLEHFAAIASHDLQEPVRTMTLYCERLKKELGTNINGASRECLFLIVDAADRMRTLINDILEYSRIGRFPSLKRVDATMLACMARDNLASEILQKKASIEIRELPRVLANPSDLTRLFQELFTNALKYSANKPPQIVVDVETEENEFKFSVRDNGIGIDEKDAESIFIIFRRLHSRGEFPGTGIGLASCRKTVESLGGRIWVERNATGGSTFLFTIPKGQRPRL